MAVLSPRQQHRCSCGSIGAQRTFLWLPAVIVVHTQLERAALLGMLASVQALFNSRRLRVQQGPFLCLDYQCAGKNVKVTVNLTPARWRAPPTPHVCLAA